MWTVNPSLPVNTGAPGDFRLTPGAGQTVASVVFRRPGAPPAPPAAALETPPDGPGARRLAELQQQAAELQARAAKIEKGLAECERRRGDPALLDSRDLAAAVARIDTEQGALRTQQELTRNALATLDVSLARARVVAQDEINAARQDAQRRRRAAALERRAALLGELARAAGPLLDQLHAAESELARP